jgi:hypothetical protein
VSHEALCQALKRTGNVQRSPTLPAAAPRRGRLHRLPGRVRSTALVPSEVTALLARHHAGESLRSLARAVGVSHETLRRAFAVATAAVSNCASA